jgi:hypothetical protein
MGMEGTDELGGLRQFLQSVDCESAMRVRVSHGFSIAILKGLRLIGTHQGEVSSPMKHGISTGTLPASPNANAQVELLTGPAAASGPKRAFSAY